MREFSLFDRIMRMQPDDELLHKNMTGRFRVVRMQFFYRVLRLGSTASARYPQRHGSKRLGADTTKRRDVASILSFMGEAAPELDYPNVARIGQRYVGFDPKSLRAIVYADSPTEAYETLLIEMQLERRAFGTGMRVVV